MSSQIFARSFGLSRPCGIGLVPVAGLLIALIIVFVCWNFVLHEPPFVLAKSESASGTPLAAAGTIEIDPSAKEAAFDTLDGRIAEYTARRLWYTVLIFQMGLMVALLAFATWTIISYTHSLAPRMLCFGLALASTIVMGVVDHCRPQSATLHQQLFVWMQAQMSAPTINRFTSSANSAAVGVGVLITSALSWILINDARYSRDAQNLHYRILLFGTAALLVTSTFQMTYEFSWVASVLEKDTSAAVKSMAAAVAASNGASFTIIAAFVFLPVAMLLERQDIGSMLAEVLAVLAPLLAALPASRLL